MSDPRWLHTSKFSCRLDIELLLHRGRPRSAEWRLFPMRSFQMSAQGFCYVSKTSPKNQMWSQCMKVFISWSDKTSHKVAETLGDWLPHVIQAVDPFISSESIDKGERWGDELNDQLKQTSYGIICLTRHNISAPWMNFEAGAISNAIRQSRVSPFLFHVESDRVTGPLQQFQQTIYGKEEILNQQEIFKLISSINDALEEAQRIPRERLMREFRQWWGELKDKLDEIWNNTEVESIAGFKWLFFQEDIIAIQSRFKCEAVWVIASHPYLEGDVKEVMKNNMKGGCVYTYIVSDSKENETFISDFEKTFACYATKAMLRKLDADDFRSIAAVDYILLTLTTLRIVRVRCFLSFP
jgi:hypothetical protein